MESINHFTRLTAAFLGLTILVLGIAAIWLIRMRKKSLKTKKAETEERGLFSQTDELVPIDEIGPGFIVTNGGKKFIVVLKCGGSDFYTKPIGEKVRVKNNYAAFISEFTSRVTYRIYGEDINMDGTVREYERILTELQDMLFETNEDYKALRKEFETVRSDFDSIDTRERSVGLYRESVRTGCCQAEPYSNVCGFLERATGFGSHPNQGGAVSGSSETFEGRYQKAASQSGGV